MIADGNKEVAGITKLVTGGSELYHSFFIVYLLNKLDGIYKTGKRKNCFRPLQSR